MSHRFYPICINDGWPGTFFIHIQQPSTAIFIFLILPHWLDTILDQYDHVIQDISMAPKKCWAVSLFYFRYAVLLSIRYSTVFDKTKLHRKNCIGKHFCVLIHGIQRHVKVKLINNCCFLVLLYMILQLVKYKLCPLIN